MITVSILINGQPIFTRSAVNKSNPIQPRHEANLYVLDDGKRIYHVPDDGAVALAIQMLKCIKEQK